MVRKDQSRRSEPAVRGEAGRGDDEVIRSDRGRGEIFAELLERRLSRRGLIRSGATVGALVLAASAPGGTRTGSNGLRSLGGGTALAADDVPADAMPSLIAFQPIAPQPVENQEIVVAPGHQSKALLRWGDPIIAGAPEWDPLNQSAAAQEQQFGYNCDYIGWHPLPSYHSMSSGHGLLWTNHEYTNPELMFAGYDEENPTEEQVNIELAAHGGAIVELVRQSDGSMVPVLSSSLNRRITGTTPMVVTGPAAGHDWLKTSDDSSGTSVLGMLNNCAGGITPWGSVLTCEENFHQYFGNLAGLAEDDPRYAVHDRYGMPDEASDRKWERFHPRFDIGGEPNEAFRFGWVVEIDPYNPDYVPVKRTALGRFRHEGATFGYSATGRVVFYSGDDAQFEYIYKYVSDNVYDPARPGIEQGLLDEGVLYVAKYNDDGSGEWLPLIYGEGPLTEENGFSSQGDVLINTRLAADLLGATKMDRPEDMQQNPVNKKIYAALTNNTRRAAEDVDAANPRAGNRYGHIIEMTESNDDAASLTFEWDIFILCGHPDDPSTYFAGFPKEQVSPISAPDNVNFDLDGNLWISTDGQPGSLELADALHAVPTEGPERGKLSQFLSVVMGAECASFEFSRDNRNLFVAIQHPGEGSTFEEPSTTWPENGTIPRPTVVQVWANDRSRVGGGQNAPVTNAAFYRTWARTDLPVAEGVENRTWIWGPQANSIEFMERYDDAPLGMRPVQYFDKSRMEVNDVDANASWEWYVTNGLLAREMITGQLQVGNDSYEDLGPAQINIAGDPDDASGPTYATFGGLLTGAPLAAGAVITQTIDRGGATGDDAGLSEYNVTAGELAPDTNHRVASVFWEFMNSSGLISRNDEYTNDRLFQSSYYATGFPITEAFWTTVRVNGVSRRVLVQAFQRRVLTYTPDNPDGWQVEAGNVGQHYFAWRYR